MRAFRLLGRVPSGSNQSMGRYQLSRKDAKINGRYHAHQARRQEAEKVEQAKQLKAQRQATQKTEQKPKAD